MIIECFSSSKTSIPKYVFGLTMACATKTVLIVALFLVFHVVQGDDKENDPDLAGAKPISGDDKENDPDLAGAKPIPGGDKENAPDLAGVKPIPGDDKENDPDLAGAKPIPGDDKENAPDLAGAKPIPGDDKEIDPDLAGAKPIPGDDKENAPDLAGAKPIPGDDKENDPDLAGAKPIPGDDKENAPDLAGAKPIPGDENNAVEGLTAVPCEDNRDCDNPSVCNDGKCSCTNDDECDYGAVCKNQICYCELKGYTDYGCSIKHDQKCYRTEQCIVKNEECSSSEHSKKLHCECKEPMSYDSKKNTCTGTLTYGKSCEKNDDCSSSLCQNKTCQCPEGTKYCDDRKICGVELHEPCIDGYDCLTTSAFCDNVQKCSCPAGMEAKKNNSICKGVKKFGEDCTTDSECNTDRAICGPEQKCSCNSTLVYMKNDDKCGKVGLGDDCSNEGVKCFDGAFCKNKTCVCDAENTRLKDKICAVKLYKLCVPNVSKCYDEGAVCADSGKCECGKNQKYIEADQSCEGLLKIGEECEQKAQCQTKAAECDSDHKCNCPGKYDEKDNKCADVISSTLMTLLTTEPSVKVPITTPQDNVKPSQTTPRNDVADKNPSGESSGNEPVKPSENEDNPSKPNTGGKDTVDETADTSSAKNVQDEDVQQGGHNIIAYIVVLLVLVVAGYIIYQNRQKILGLILEGRQGPGDRKGRVRYRKLTTEDVMPTTEDKSAMKGYVF